MKQQIKHAFTLTELIVVMVIIAALMALALPLVSTLIGQANQDLTYNMIDTAGKNARSFVKTQAKVFTAEDKEGDLREYGGIALVVTHNNTLMLYESVETTIVNVVEEYRDNNGNLRYRNYDNDVDSEPLKTGAGEKDILDADYQAFRKVKSWEEVTLPQKSIVLGLIMEGSTAKFIAPPFAMRFNASSQLIYHAKASNESSFVIIDGDYDTYFETDKTRAGYDFQSWYIFGDSYQDFEPSTNEDEPGLFQIYTDDDSRAPSGSTANNREEFFRYVVYNGQTKFPFDRLEAVMGLVIVDRDEFQGEASADLVDGTLELATDGGKWVLSNGTIVMFNPQTGAAELGQINARQ